MIENYNEKVCTVVVTYNRKNLLLECLDALLKQTRSTDAICLIDNASTDGTPELLKENKYIDKLPDYKLTRPIEESCFICLKGSTHKTIPFYYVRMPENTGGAGGFYEGIKRAYEKGYDWLWLMDDDVEPLPDGLKNLLSYSRLSKCIQPSRCLPDGKRFPWGNIITKAGKLIPINNNLFLDKSYIEVSTGCFEGMFIHKDIIAKIGFPMKELFMVGDDTLYGWMAYKHTKLIYIKDFCLKKKIEPKKAKNPLTEYLFFRNNYLLLKLFTGNSNIARIKYLFFVIKKFISRLVKYRSKSLAYAVFKGYLDAIRNDFSNNYLKKLLLNKN